RAGPAPGATLPCPPRGECLDEDLGPLAASYRGAQRRGSLGGEPALAGIGMLGHPDSPSGEALGAPDRQRRGSAALATASGHWPRVGGPQASREVSWRRPWPTAGSVDCIMR